MTGHRSRFPGCQYGPLALRPLLRRQLQPGERVLGFGAADTAGPGWRALALLTIALPTGGLRITQVIHRRRVLIHTDRRLIILAPERPALDSTAPRWNAEIPLSQVEFQPVRARTCWIHTPGTRFLARLRGRWAGLPLASDPAPDQDR
ncbi:MAG: hypothetical protein ACNA8P_05735 [Phycisphaerales bacterium]